MTDGMSRYERDELAKLVHRREAIAKQAAKQRAAELTADHVDASYRYEPLEGEGHWLPEQAPATVARLFVDHAQQLR